MNRVTHFSKHALKRLEQRSTLGFYDLAKILDCQMFINIGREPGFNREHRLFYSIQDEMHFVAIQDIHTGGVVTVLPPEYHENISWKIKDNELNAAKSIALDPPDEFKNCRIYDEFGANVAQEAASTFIISAHFNDSDGNQKTKTIVKIKSEPYSWDISILLKDKSLDSEIDRGLTLKNINSHSVWSISIRHGRRGDAVLFGWEQGLV